MVFALFPHPDRLRRRAAAAVARPGSFGWIGWPADRDCARPVPAADRAGAARPADPVRGRPVAARSARRRPAIARGRVALLQGCVQRVFFSDVNRATVARAGRRGLRGDRAGATRGAAARCTLHAGEEKEARALARRAIAALEDCDLIAVNAAGCGSAMKEYGPAAGGRPAVARPRPRVLRPRPRRVRDPGRRAGRGAAAPGADAGRLPRRVPPRARAGRARASRATRCARSRASRSWSRAEWEICCGSAGLYNVLQPDAAAELGRRKAENLLATGAEAIVAANPGCALQITDAPGGDGPAAARLPPDGAAVGLDPRRGLRTGRPVSLTPCSPASATVAWKEPLWAE